MDGPSNLTDGPSNRTDTSSNRTDKPFNREDNSFTREDKSLNREDKSFTGEDLGPKPAQTRKNRMGPRQKSILPAGRASGLPNYSGKMAAPGRQDACPAAFCRGFCIYARNPTSEFRINPPLGFSKSTDSERPPG